ncbi:hypothetical protein [Sporomusa sphaeroides]|uniref:hypothetical protein n=1 Tax=Sporomusa sphaeroides TaxID=47679 RepID=UPI0032C22D82
MIDQEYIKLENYFLDGTKIEANANKYSWVWGKSTKRYKEKSGKMQRAICRSGISQPTRNDEYGDENLEELGGDKPIDSKAIVEAVKRIDEKLAANPTDRKLKKAKKTIETAIPRRIPMPLLCG